MIFRACILAFCASLAASAAPHAEPVAAQELGDIDCVPHIRQAEAYLRIPQNLLLAISLVESAYQGYPHPWALNIAGQAHFATDFKAAARLLRDGQGRPRRDVDVGCMQIHMGSHLHRFSGHPELALIPKNNVWYAGTLLVELRQQSVNWSQAVARYHNWSDSTRQRTYLCSVIAMWNRLNRVSSTPATTSYCKPVVASR